MRSALKMRYYTSGRVLHLKKCYKHGMRQTGMREKMQRRLGGKKRVSCRAGGS